MRIVSLTNSTERTNKILFVGLRRSKYSSFVLQLTVGNTITHGEIIYIAKKNPTLPMVEWQRNTRSQARDDSFKYLTFNKNV
jgi:hypothetical protein